MIKWKPFVFGGEVYNLTHLHPFDKEYTQAATKDKPELKYKINVRFSLHCFTRGKDKKNLANEDARLFFRSKKECRIFCFERHELSKKLPSIIDNIFERKCYHTAHKNYFTVDLINRDGISVEYQVYFTVTKCTINRGTLILYVQSAYPNTKNIRRKSKKPIKFRVIAYNTLKNKPTNPAP